MIDREKIQESWRFHIEGWPGEKATEKSYERRYYGGMRGRRGHGGKKLGQVHRKSLMN